MAMALGSCLTVDSGARRAITRPPAARGHPVAVTGMGTKTIGRGGTYGGRTEIEGRRKVTWLIALLGAGLLACTPAPRQATDWWAPSPDDDLAVLPPPKRRVEVSEAERRVGAGRTADSLALLGSAYLFDRQGQRALETFEACLEVAPDDLRCAGGRAQALFALRDYVRAASEFRTVAPRAVTPRGKALLLDQAGLSAWLAGDLKAAEADYRAALGASPEEHLPQRGLGRVLGQQRRYAEAVPLLDSAAASDSRAMRSSASLWAALALLEMGDPAAARIRVARIERGDLSKREAEVLRRGVAPRLGADQ